MMSSKDNNTLLIPNASKLHYIKSDTIYTFSVVTMLSSTIGFVKSSSGT